MTVRKLRDNTAPLGESSSDRETNLLEWLYTLRDHQRRSQGQSAWVIKGAEVPWERNRQGRMQWYLHPALDQTPIRSMIFFRQEIPPKGRSGAQKVPGGAVFYVLKGRGYTLLDEDRHDWAAEDVINIPIRSDGVVVQHFNIDSTETALIICADLNLVDFLGVDRGSALEQVEDALE